MNTTKSMQRNRQKVYRMGIFPHRTSLSPRNRETLNSRTHIDLKIRNHVSKSVPFDRYVLAFLKCKNLNPTAQVAPTRI